MGIGAPTFLAIAAFSGESEIAGASLFLIALACAAFFVDGGFANLAPYTSEIYPTAMRTHGMGLAWMMSGLGRIIGPAGVGLIAGSDDPIDPEATLSALEPGFLFLAGVLAARADRLPAREARAARLGPGELPRAARGRALRGRRASRVGAPRCAPAGRGAGAR